MNDALEILNRTLFSIGDTAVTLAALLTLVGIVLGTLITSALAQRAAVRALKFRGVEAEGTVGVVRRLLHYVLLAIGFALATRAMGIDLSALFAAGAIFAVGLGFAMQSIAQNFVAGVILLVERAIKPGDVLGVDGTIVRVRRMGIRATIAATRDGEDLLIPNSLLIQSTVKNYTLEQRSFRIRVPVGVVYRSDMRQVRQTLETVAQKVAEDFQALDRRTQVVMTGFGDNSVNFEVAAWIPDPWEFRAALSRMHEAIWWGLHDEGIVIAFPQLDVHLDPPVEEGLRSLSTIAAKLDAPTSRRDAP